MAKPIQLGPVLVAAIARQGAMLVGITLEGGEYSKRVNAGDEWSRPQAVSRDEAVATLFGLVDAGLKRPDAKCMKCGRPMKPCGNYAESLICARCRKR